MNKPLSLPRGAVAGALILVLPTLAPAQTAAPPAAGPVQPATREAQALPSLAPLVESVKSAVVNVDVQSRGGESDEMSVGQNPFGFFGGDPRSGRRREAPVRQGTGSGFIIDPKGLVLTNNHVVEGAVSIRVRLDDGRAFEAEIVGRDPLTDVALIRLKKAENLPTVKLGDSDAMRVGDWVLAIGNPFGLASSVSSGILSARARNIHAGPYDDFLQTDAAINPGNSGGPLFNLKGEVVGINTAIVGGGTGIGFSVPSNLVKALLPQLEKSGAVTRAWLGIGIQDLNAELARALKLPVNEGAIVTLVNEDSPAGRAGMKQDDVIVTLDGQKVASGGELTRSVALKTPGSTSTVELYRDGKKQTVKVQLGTRPDIERVGERSRKGEDSDAQSSKARVGLSLSNVDPRMAQRAGLKASQGALITEVQPGSPAERAELEPGMVVVEADRKPVTSAESLAAVIRKTPAGGTVLLRVLLPSGQSLRALSVP
ncbi:trypsin-like peptidase domain-containing protein [Archangium primigenium]|uniref:trypsin-like peptidase domain-containing protein n=1 Tax=[Archangium] primigenium TaxID=2792470 RepID=UPI00195D7D73|nr:trypsin-like peptidase domain-containing protein [Archangium primigenium]MBM7115328.1 trypsin-like peptidase domain-containing protein [Archangium primigenium]